jgi:hypothetical protein
MPKLSLFGVTDFCTAPEMRLATAVDFELMDRACSQGDVAALRDRGDSRVSGEMTTKQ